MRPLPFSPRPGRSGIPILSSFLMLTSTLAVTLCGAAAQAPDDAPPRLTLERLYSLPSLIGTAPRGVTWSPDGERFAFLWNDGGREFLDAWVVQVGVDARPVRWTDLRPAAAGRMPTSGAVGGASVQPVDQPWRDAVAAETEARDGGLSSLLWHPDGERLLVSRGRDLVAVRGPGAEPVPFLESVRAPAFAPDGASLAFLRDGDLWLADAEGGAARRLTAVARDGVRVAMFDWSPAGDRLAVVESDLTGVTVRGIPDYLGEETVLHEVRRAYPGEEPERRRVGLVEASAGSPVTPHWIDLSDPSPDMLLSVAWSPDGERLAVDTSDLYAKDRRVFVVEAGADGRSSAPRVVARDADPMNETFYFWRIAWSTDGEHLYFLSDRETDFHVWSVPAAGGEARPLTAGDWAVAEMTAVEGGLVVVGNRGRAEERHLFRVVDPAGAAAGVAEPVRLSVRPGTHAAVVSPDGTRAAVSFSSDDTPPDLFLTDLTADPPAAADGARPASAEVRVTASPLPEFETYRWVTPRYVSFESHVDGTTLHGRLTLPPDFDPSRTYPAILGSVYTDSVRNQWGGRTAHPTWGLDQYLAQEGFVLLNVDVRGSWGRGREHRRGIRLDYGGMDIEDLESGVRYLGTLGAVDLDRVGIWGSSYGGLMTAMSLFRKPDVYAAGVAGAPATNVRHALTGQMAVMMRPEDQPAEYDDSSPFLHAHGLEDPLMIIHGMRDRVVLFKDSVVLTQRLIQLDRDVDLVTLPDAGHGWDLEGLAQTRYAFRRLVEHFRRHLGGGSR